MMKRLCRWTFVLGVAGVALAGDAEARERIVGGPCEGCENVFVGMPEKIGHQSRIAPADEPGEPMVITGTVRNLAGEPVPGVIVYAYHTDRHGVYPEGRTRHGRFRAWARTDDEGDYRFDTIRPAAYPRGSIPQHVHMHVIEPGRVTYYIDDLLFEDDPLLTAARRGTYVRGRGGEGVDDPRRDENGVWHVRRDITLGMNIPGYPCERRWTFPVPFYQSASWSPNGNRIAFSAVSKSWDDGYRIFIVGSDGAGLRKIETGAEEDLYPAWSPDGRRVVFASRRDGNSDIFSMLADGTDVVRLTSHEASDSYPTVSPDGDRIAFHSNRDGNYEIYVMNADGSAKQRITNHPADDYNPAWSPDGERIAFDSDRDETEGDEIYVIDPDGSDVARVVDAGVFPTWSPDGKRIVFANEGLFVVGVDGSGRSRLLENAVFGAWSRATNTIVAAEITFDDTCADQHRLILMSPGSKTGPKPLLR